jgi:hypothetical protein
MFELEFTSRQWHEEQGPQRGGEEVERTCCRVTRLITRVTGRPLSAAGWKVSNLTYLQPCRAMLLLLLQLKT